MVVGQQDNLKIEFIIFSVTFKADSDIELQLTLTPSLDNKMGAYSPIPAPAQGITLTSSFNFTLIAFNSIFKKKKNRLIGY